MRLLGDDPATLLQLLHSHGFSLRSQVLYGGKAWLVLNGVGAFYNSSKEANNQTINPSSFATLANRLLLSPLGRSYIDMIAERQEL